MSTFRQLMMKNKANYELLEYLQATGEQYIDTGYVPSQDSKVEIVVEVLNRTNSPYLFGSGISWENSAFALAFNQNTSIGLIFCYGNNTSNRAGVFAINQKYKVTMSKDGCEIYRYSSSSVIYSKGAYSPQTFSSNASALIFYAMNLGAGTDIAKMKLYSCKIWESGVLVRDYVPVIKPNGIAGLLDNVHNKFYGNVGTGKFLSSQTVGYTKVGSPTITDGVLIAPTDKQNTIKTSESLDVGDGSFEMQFCLLNPTLKATPLFRVNDNHNTRCTCSATNTFNLYPNYQADSNVVLRALGTFWSKAINNSASKVYLKIKCTGKDTNNEYPFVFSGSLDGVNWQEETVISSLPLATGVIQFCSSYASFSSGTQVKYDLDLKETWIKKDGKIWFINQLV